MSITSFRSSPPHKEGCWYYADCHCFDDEPGTSVKQTDVAKLIQAERERIARIIYRMLPGIDNSDVRSAMEMLAVGIRDSNDNGF